MSYRLPAACVTLLLSSGATRAAEPEEVAVADLPHTFAEYPIDGATRVEIVVSSCKRTSSACSPCNCGTLEAWSQRGPLHGGLTAYDWAAIAAPGQPTVRIGRMPATDRGQRYSLSFGWKDTSPGRCEVVVGPGGQLVHWPQNRLNMTARSAPGPGLAAVPVIEELFALGEFAAALRLSEQVRCSGYLDARLAVLQVVCLDQLGLGDAAATRTS